MTRMDDLSLATIAKVGVVLVVVLPYPVYLAWRRYRNYRLYVKVRRDFAIYTAMDDLSVLGTLEPKTKLEGTAVIAGGRWDYRHSLSNSITITSTLMIW